MSRVALPPGFYTVKNNSTNMGIANPVSAGSPLSVTGVNTTDPAQQWLISGGGVFLGKNNGNGATVTLPSLVAATINSNVIGSAVPFIVNVTPVNDGSGSFIGYIMTNDNVKNFWGVNGSNQIYLQSVPLYWTFTPVPV